MEKEVAEEEEKKSFSQSRKHTTTELPVAILLLQETIF